MVTPTIHKVVFDLGLTFESDQYKRKVGCGFVAFGSEDGILFAQLNAHVDIDFEKSQNIQIHNILKKSTSDSILASMRIIVTNEASININDLDKICQELKSIGFSGSLVIYTKDRDHLGFYIFDKITVILG